MRSNIYTETSSDARNYPSILQGAEEIELPQFKLLSSETDFKDYKRCFKACSKTFSESFLSSKEEKCSSTYLK